MAPRRAFAPVAALLLIATAPAVAGCGGGASSDVPPGVQVARSDLARIVDPNVPAADRQSLADGNTAFALDLYGQVQADPGNLFLSPYSISVALAMTYAGARTNTEQQMAQALHFDLPQSQLHPAFNALDQELAGRADAATENGDGDAFQLHIVNQMWAEPGYPFSSSYLDVLGQNYGAGVFLIDFAADPEQARTTINDWVAGQTADRIQDLIPQGVITSLTRFVLTNAVYFKASWLLPFDPADTATGTFHRQDGSTVDVPFMHEAGELRYAAGAGWQAVELPYATTQLDMVLILPDAGQLAAFEAGLDAPALSAILSALTDHMTTVDLPKFQFRSQLDLDVPLQALGMTDAFDPSLADFSGMDGSRALYVQKVVHQGFVSVNEEGTEAAAATAVIGGVTSVPQPAQITLDHPFLLLVRDGPTGTILFLGRVVDPS